jgi:hypothetical protein
LISVSYILIIGSTKIIAVGFSQGIKDKFLNGFSLNKRNWAKAKIKPYPLAKANSNECINCGRLQALKTTAANIL